MKRAAGLLLIASGAVVAAGPSSETFRGAGEGYLTRGSYALQRQLESCQQFAFAGDQGTARTCEQRLHTVDRFLRSVAATGPYSPAAWQMCSSAIDEDLEIGARCLIGVTHACHISGGTIVNDYARCLQLVESRVILLNPIARSYDFKGPAP